MLTVQSERSIFNSERKVTQRIRSLFPCWSDKLLVHWPLPNFLSMCMYLYLTMVVEKFSLLVFLFFFKPFFVEDRRCPGNMFFFDGMLCYCQWRFGCNILNWWEQAANTKSAPCKLLQSSFNSSFPVGVCIIKWALSSLKSLDLETAA